MNFWTECGIKNTCFPNWIMIISCVEKQQRSQRNYLILYIDCKFSCRRWCGSIDYTQNPLQNVNNAKEFAKTYKTQIHFDARLKLNRFVGVVWFILFAFGIWPWSRDILIHLNSLTFDRTTSIINSLIFHFFFALIFWTEFKKKLHRKQTYFRFIVLQFYTIPNWFYSYFLWMKFQFFVNSNRTMLKIKLMEHFNFWFQLLRFGRLIFKQFPNYSLNFDHYFEHKILFSFHNSHLNK